MPPESFNAATSSALCWVSVQEYRSREYAATIAPATEPHLDLVTFGGTDLIRIGRHTHLYELAAPAPIHAWWLHRSQGAALTNLPSGRLLAPADELLTPSPEAPFCVVSFVKLDPLANLLAGHRLIDDLLAGLDELLAVKLADLDDLAQKSFDRLQFTDRAAAEDMFTVRLGADHGGLRVAPLIGLDASELVLIARAPSVEPLMRMSWALRRLRGRDLPRTFSAVPDDRMLAEVVPQLPRGDCSGVPILAYTATTLGIPRQLLDDPPADYGTRLACRQGAVSVSLSSAPRHESLIDAVINSLGTPTHAVRRASSLGRHDQAVHLGAGSISADGRLLPGETFGPQTWAQLFAALSPPHLNVPGAERAAIRCETSLSVEAFPPGTSRPDRADDGSASDVADWFDAGLARVSMRVLERYQQVKQANQQNHAAYSTTYGVLNLMSSIANLLSVPRELEGYLDVVEPLGALVRALVDATEPQEELDRLQRNLERVVRNRASRDSLLRPGEVSRTIEARAGHVVPRDACIAYLDEMFRRRVGAPHSLLVIDDIAPRLVTKLGGPTSLFHISTSRIRNPSMWPGLAHEVEHVRIHRQAVPDDSPAVLEVLELQARVGGVDRPIVERCRHGYATVGLLLRDARGVTEKLKHGSADLFEIAGAPSSRYTAMLEETACDLALIDAGALGEATSNDDLQRRLLFVTIPNLALDLRRRWHAALDQPTAARWALRICARLAGDLALAPMLPSASCADLRERLVEVLHQPLWGSACAAVLHECWGQRRTSTATHAELSTSEAGLLVGSARDRLGALLVSDSRGESPWAQLLHIVHLLRRRSTDEPILADDPRHVVAEHLQAVRAAHAIGAAELGEPELYPLLRSRWELAGAAAAAERAGSLQLFSRMRPAVRRLRARGLAALLADE